MNELGKVCVAAISTTPDPNTSAKVSRYKWEAYRDTHWWCKYYFGRAPKYRTQGCSRYWRPKFVAREWLKCCKNQCSHSQAVSGWAWTPFCVILWGWLILSAKRRSYFCKSIAIEMGGVSRYFSSKVSGSGVDVTLLNLRCSRPDARAVWTLAAKLSNSNWGKLLYLPLGAPGLHL